MVPPGEIERDSPEGHSRFEGSPAGTMRPIDFIYALHLGALWIPGAAQGGAKWRGGALLLGVRARRDHRLSSHEDVAYAVGVPGKERDAERFARREPLEIEVGAVEHDEIGAPSHGQDAGGVSR